MATGKTKYVLLTLALIAVFTVIFRKKLIRATLPELEKVQLAEVALLNDSAYVKFTLTVRNKGFWNIELRSVTVNIYDDTTLVLSYQNDTLKKLARNEIKTEELYCTLPLTKIMGQIREHQGEDSVGLRMEGVFVYSTIFGEMTSSVTQRLPVKVPIPPQLFVRQIEYMGKHDGGYDLLYHITLWNENPRTLELENISYTLQSEDKLNMEGSIDNIAIEALDSTLLVLPVHLKVTNKFGLITRIILDKDDMNYSFVLKGTITSFTDIVKEDVPVVITRYGILELYNKDKVNRPKITFRKK